MFLLIRQKLVENVKIEKFKCVILEDYQTLCDDEHCYQFLKKVYFWHYSSFSKINLNPS